MGAAGSTASIKRISRACPSGIWREEEEREPNGWTRNRVASRSQARLSPRSPPIYSSCPYNPLPIFQNNSWQAPVTCDHRGSKLCRQYWSCIVISSALTVFQFQVLHALSMIVNFRIPQSQHLWRMTLISLTYTEISFFLPGSRSDSPKLASQTALASGSATNLP